MKQIKISCKDVVDLTVKVLKSEGIVIFPTDTLYGLLGVVSNISVLERIACIKGRELSKPFPIFVSSLDMASRYVVVDDDFKVLFDRFLPGPLTIVAKAKVNIPYVTSSHGKIGVRIPDVPVLIRIIEEVGVPLTGTSANFSGGKPPASFEEISSDLIESVDLVVDGGVVSGVASTVFDVVEKRIIREGAIDGGTIFRILGK